LGSTVRDVMSTRVVAVRPGAGYKEMAATLREQRVSAFPVIDAENKVIGVISESDLLAREAVRERLRYPLVVTAHSDPPPV
jgi:CBS-domain-containing membrane protein